MRGTTPDATGAARRPSYITSREQTGIKEGQHWTFHVANFWLNLGYLVGYPPVWGGLRRAFCLLSYVLLACLMNLYGDGRGKLTRLDDHIRSKQGARMWGKAQCPSCSRSGLATDVREEVASVAWSAKGYRTTGKRTRRLWAWAT